MQAMFQGMNAAAAAPMVQFKAGKMTLNNTTLTPDARKGLLVLRTAPEDGLMHLIWKVRDAAVPEDDLVVFEGDASFRRLEECTDGYAMLFEFSQSGRKLFFYSQEPRKKSAKGDWTDVKKEKELMDKANSILSGNSGATAGGAGGASPSGALGMSQSELLAMLNAVQSAAGAGAAAPASTPAPTAPPSAEAAAPTAAAPTGGLDVSAALGALPASTPAPAGGGAAAPFSADAISNILGNLGTPATGGGAAAAPAAAAGGQFSADAISNILGTLQQAAPPAEPLTLNEVLRPEGTAPLVDAAMESQLSQHLPEGGNIPDSARDTLNTPQMAQAAARFTEALYRGEAAGLVHEMRLNPTGPGVEPFLRALQASTDAEKAKEEENKDDKMDES